MTDWIAVIAKPGQAFRAAQQLRNQECEVFVPECRVMVKKARQSVPEVRPLLGNYLFCLPNIPIRTILSTYGVQSYIRKADGRPDTIRQSVMDDFIAMTSVVCDMTPQSASYYIGQKLTVKTGPFSGISGLVVDILKGELKIDLTNGKNLSTIRVSKSMVEEQHA